MLRIRRLYSEPKVFDPITFIDGVNLILGEKSENSVKTNGVGKSLSIEFINYGLLKEHKRSRIASIPPDVLPPDVLICLDIYIGGKEVTIKRSINSHKTPTFIIDGESTTYASLEDANNYLTHLLFGSEHIGGHPSFRVMISPLLRDERSEFKDIIACFDTNERGRPLDFSPHLYLFGIDPQAYFDAVYVYRDTQKIKTARSKLRRDVEKSTGKSFAEANADLNDLSSQVKRIEIQIDNLQNSEGYDIVKDDILSLEQRIEDERAREAVLRAELVKLRLFKGDNYIDEEEVGELYNQFRDGLGDLIQKELNEVVAFKKKIDDFQRNLIETRKDTLQRELSGIKSRVASLDKKYQEFLSLLDQRGMMKSLRQTIATYQAKTQDHATLSALVGSYENLDRELKEQRQKRNHLLSRLDLDSIKAEHIIDSFEETILAIHEYVAGNRRSSFTISVSPTSTKREAVKFDLRTYDDGSHSNEREKVFIYDLALLINEETSKRHPGFLVHDNIFSVDHDTLIQSLNYLNDYEHLLADKQYILTINRDEFTEEDIESNLKLDIERLKRAAFTKDNRFLRANYQEV